MSAFNKIVNKILSLRANGQYKYAIRRWDDISDIDLATSVLSIDPFKGELAQIPIDVSKYKQIMVLAPHQDDETIGCGGLMLKAKSLNIPIDIVYITDGSSEKPKYSTENIEESITIRNAEAKLVADELNAEIYYIGICNHTPNPNNSHIEKLADLIKDRKPDLLLTPWILDSPAKHRLSNYILHLAYKNFGLPNIEILGYQVHNDLIPNVYLNISDFIDEKIKLTSYFKSQNDFFQRYDHLVLGMAIWNGRFFHSPQKKYYEVFNSLPLNEFSALIEKFYPIDWNKTMKGHSKVLNGLFSLISEQKK
jgi:LmbE family N-acetylglucosaminyl deacetylase